MNVKEAMNGLNGAAVAIGLPPSARIINLGDDDDSPYSIVEMLLPVEIGRRKFGNTTLIITDGGHVHFTMLHGNMHDGHSHPHISTNNHYCIDREAIDSIRQFTRAKNWSAALTNAIMTMASFNPSSPLNNVIPGLLVCTTCGTDQSREDSCSRCSSYLCLKCNGHRCRICSLELCQNCIDASGEAWLENDVCHKHEIWHCGMCKDNHDASTTSKETCSSCGTEGCLDKAHEYYCESGAGGTTCANHGGRPVRICKDCRRTVQFAVYCKECYARDHE